MEKAKIGILRGIMLEATIFSAVLNGLLLIMPLYLIQVYDRVLPSASMETLAYLSIIALAGLLVMGILDIVRSLFANRIAARLDVRLGGAAFLASMQSPKAALGDIQPLRDLATLRTFMASRILFFLFDLPFSPIFIAIMYLIHPVMFWITVFGALVMLALAMLNQLATARSVRVAGDNLQRAMNSAQSFARSFETIRALGMVANVSERWGHHSADAAIASDKFGSVNAYYGGLARTFRMVLQIALMGVGAYLVIQGQMTAGMIFAASIISGRALQPIDQIIGAWRQIIDAMAAWRRVSAAERATVVKGTFDLPTPKGALAVEDAVYFIPGTEANGVPLIKRVSFAVPAGASLAIVGPSQAGKSTLARLIVGAIPLRSGTVRLDGADIQTFDSDVLGRHIGYLPQETDLFPGTVGENISRFDANASDADTVEAAKRANAHDLVLSLAEGYSTEIGPTAARLSGGERQRIGLARAFYGDPKLVVLDEPNANLDADGEKALEGALLEARKRGTTVIVITHRPAIANICDRMMILKAGQIEAIGTPEEIRQKMARTPEPTPGSPASGSRQPIVVTPTKEHSASFGRVMRVKAD